MNSKLLFVRALELVASCAATGMAFAAEVTPTEISVLSWNTQHHNFERRPAEERRELEENMFALIREANPDIFLIQETYGSFERFQAAFPEYHGCLQSECNSLFSKFPISGSRRLWTDRMAKNPPVFNTPILEFADVTAGALHLRVSSFAMFWEPLCIYTPPNLSPEELLAWELTPQGHPLTPRPKAIREALAAMAPLLAEKERVPLIIGGDFNSMSHLDWTRANGAAEGHCGRAVPWAVSTAMIEAGFVDSYRAVHPDEVADYGVTVPMAGCDSQRPRPLVRLDYVYSAGSSLRPIASETIGGPFHKPFAWRGRKFSMFPSDHAAVLTRYAVSVPTNRASRSAKVSVGWNEPVGAVKPVHGVGQPPMVGAPLSYRMMHHLKRAGIPYSRLHDVGGAYGGMRYVDIPNIFRDFDADEGDPKNYDFTATDKLMLALAANGVEPFYRLGVTIVNSAGEGFPAYRIFPPKDYAKWARICEHVIRHYTEGWADGYRFKITHWEIWNEPDNNPEPEKNPMFRALFEEYMRLYGTVAPYLKAKFPHLKIGGYGSCGFYAAVGSDRIPAAHASPRNEHFVECAHKFLKAVRENKWPLDFFSFHSYSDPVEALRQVRYARELLDGYGFRNVPTCFNEWLPLPSLGARGTPHQAAMIAAELIGLQNGPCDMAMIYDARCGGGDYSPLFNPLTEKPHKAYFALLAFNQLYQLGTAVKAVSSDKDLWVAAARKGERGAIMLANCSDRAIPLDIQAEGLTFRSWDITSPKHWDEYFCGKLPKAIPADSFIVCFYNSQKATWERPKTTRRYLQGPLASHLAVLFREGKLLLGDMHHAHDWQKMPYSAVWAHGVWLTHGEDMKAFDFKKAELSTDPDAVPIAAQKWREGDLEVSLEACVPFGRFPNAHLRVRATNRGASRLKDDFAFLVRLAPEQDLVFSAPDCYASYRPEVRQWFGVPDLMRVSPEDGALRSESGHFVKFGDATPFVWDRCYGAARMAVDLKPGETRTIDCVVGRGATERPHYDEVREQVRADWLKELQPVSGKSALIRNLTVQMLQNFARPAKGDYILPRQGGLQRWVWPGDNRAVCAALDRLGYGDYVEKAIDFYFGEYQQPSGEVGKFGNGWVSDTASCLTIFSRHALACGDASYWKRGREAAAKAYGWIRDTRERDGLFPALKSADSEKIFRNWGATDCTNLEALEHFARAAERFADPIAAEAAQTAADYRAAIGGFLDRWRKAAKGKEEFFIPFAPDGSNEEDFAQNFYYMHPGFFAKLGFMDADELLRVRNWMARTGVALPERGLHAIMRDGVIGRGAEGYYWYTTWPEHHWFKAWRRVGRDDLARQALEACLNYAVTDEYQVGERYQAADPWFYPWSPNASGAGRIVQMLLDLGEQ